MSRRRILASSVVVVLVAVAAVLVAFSIQGSKWKYSSIAIDVQVEGVEIGTAFRSNRFGLLASEPRQFVVFRRRQSDPATFEVVWQSSASYPDPPFRPRFVELTSDSAV